jgi:hypothetical protein
MGQTKGSQAVYYYGVPPVKKRARREQNQVPNPKNKPQENKPYQLI